MAFGNNVTLDDILRYHGLPGAEMAPGGTPSMAPDPTQPTPVTAPTGMFAATPRPTGLPDPNAPMAVAQPNFTAPNVPSPSSNQFGGLSDKLTNIGAILLSASGSPAGSALMQAQAQKRSEALGQQRIDSENARADARLNKPQVHYGEDGSISTLDPVTGAVKIIQQGTGASAKAGPTETEYNFFNKIDPTGGLARQYATQAAAGPPVMGTGPNGQPMMYSRSSMAAPVASSSVPVSIKSESDYNALAAGAPYIAPDGSHRVKGGSGASAQATFPSVMNALTSVESSGRVGVQGPQTQYGRAQGSTQLLPATAQEQAGKLGVPWRPDLMSGTSPQAAQYQQALGQSYLQEGIQKTGNLRDGLRYYHGGPNPKQWGPKTDAYADAVLSRLNA